MYLKCMTMFLEDQGSGSQVRMCDYSPDQSYHDTSKECPRRAVTTSLRQPCWRVLLCATRSRAPFRYLKPRWCSCISQHCKSCCFWFRYESAFLSSALCCLALQTNTCRLPWFPPPALPCLLLQGRCVTLFHVSVVFSSFWRNKNNMPLRKFLAGIERP